MYALIKPFVRLCFFNANPQDLPASEVLLGITLFAYAAVSMLLALPVYGIGIGFLQAILELVLLIVYTRIVLHLAQQQGRYVQTLSALAGTGVVFGLISIPLVYPLYQSVTPQATPDMTILRAYILILAWLVVVYGHVFRHALSSRMSVGLLVGFGYVFFTSMIINTVLPPPLD